ncbi:MAG: tetratricopeptide repeat protein [Candidatus Binatia bacterium]|nr:tetratricopeptide repeat protein [Candidatus Binatia bacterium]
MAESQGRYWDLGSGQLLLPFLGLTDERPGRPAPVTDIVQHRSVSGEQAREDPAERWYSLAIAREEAGDVEGARQAYLAALGFDPSLSDACVNLGRLAHYEGSVQRAASWYRRALEIAPDDPIAHYNLAIALEDLGDMAGAIKEYQRALECDWEFPEAHFNLSRLLRVLGQQLAAMRHLKVYRQLTGSSH